MMQTRLWYQKPEALRELGVDRHGLIAASAGTGKTYTLQHLLVEILLQGEVRIDKILLVTFTVAATSDLKRKIREILEELTEGWEWARAQGMAEAVLEGGEIRPVEGVDEPEKYWAIEVEEVQRLRHGLRNFDRAAIYTIHGFCQRVLVEHAFENRRLFDQEHVSEADVIAQAFAEMLREDIRPETQAQQWLTAYLGAGNRIEELRDKLGAYLGSSGVYRPVVELSLDRFQADLERFSELFGGLGAAYWEEWLGGRKVHGGTRKAMIKRFAALEAYFDSGFDSGRPASAVEAFVAFDKHCAEPVTYLARSSPQKALKDDSERGESIFEMAKYLGSLDFVIVSIFGELLKKRVARIKEREGYFTFDDMVQVVRDRLVEGGEEGNLLGSIRAQFTYGLIDEFQDTDAKQWEIFKRVFVESEEGHRLYLIGDPKQAIYGFRGGDVNTYLEARDHLRGLQASEAQLGYNFRSTPQVIDAYNAIFDGESEGSIDLGEGIEYPAKGVKAGKDWLWLDRGKKEDEDRAAGVTLMELQTKKEKLAVDDIRRGVERAYAAEIRRVLKEDWRYSTDEEGGEAGVEAQDIYVLCRRRKDLHSMAKALRMAGVPFAFMKMDGLFDTAEAEDVYDLLLAVADPMDRSRRARAWMTPFFDLSLSDLEGISEIGEEAAIFERLLKWSRLGARRDWGALFSAMVEESGLIRRRLFLERGERELTNYLHLLEILAEETARKAWTVEELARRFKAFIDGRQKPQGEDREQQRLETEEQAVQLLTIHASKGLQRGVVFAVPKFGGISTRTGPFRFHDGETGELVEWHDSKSQMSDADEKRYEAEAKAEELRLAYVALTRAELQIFMPFADRDSVVYGVIKKDPFTQVIDRAAALREDSATAGLFSTRQVDLDEVPVEVGLEQARASLASIADGSELVTRDVPAPAMELSRRREILGRRWEITSYSKLKTRARTVEREEEKGDFDVARQAGELAGGMATGNFLHLVMEKLDYRRVQELSRDQWVVDEKIGELFEECARRFGSYDEAAMRRAKEMVYDTLRASVELPGGGVVDELWRLEEGRLKKEQAFLFPVAQEAQGALKRRFRSGAEIKGGFVTGIVDLLFEYDGRVYFADWKSDLAAPYDEESLSRHVEERYSEQANLYTLALCRMLGVEDQKAYEELFGGYLYLFIRGMGPAVKGGGVYSGRVAWGDLVEYERGLLGAVNQAKVVGLEIDEAAG